MCLVLGKEMLTKLTRSHLGSETVKYHWELLQVALGMYTQEVLSSGGGRGSASPFRQADLIKLITESQTITMSEITNNHSLAQSRRNK